MKVLLTLTIFSFLQHFSSGHYQNPKLASPSKSFGERNLVAILNSGRHLLSSATTRECYDNYVPLINGAISSGKRNAQKCVKKAEESKETEIESVRIVRESLNEKVKYATSTLGSCTAKHDALEYFSCLEYYTPLVEAALAEVETTSVLLKQSLLMAFDDIKNEEKCCIDNALSESEYDSEVLVNELQTCLVNGEKPETPTVTGEPIPGSSPIYTTTPAFTETETTGTSIYTTMVVTQSTKEPTNTTPEGKPTEAGNTENTTDGNIETTKISQTSENVENSEESTQQAETTEIKETIV